MEQGLTSFTKQSIIIFRCRLVGKFNHSHTVADIKQFIIEYPYYLKIRIHDNNNCMINLGFGLTQQSLKFYVRINFVRLLFSLFIIFNSNSPDHILKWLIKISLSSQHFPINY